MEWIIYLIQHIPEVLMYILPGFISLRLRETFGLHKKQKELNTILYSILYSFIIQLAFNALKFLGLLIFPSMAGWAIKSNIKTFPSTL